MNSTISNLNDVFFCFYYYFWVVILIYNKKGPIVDYITLIPSNYSEYTKMV